MSTPTPQKAERRVVLVKPGDLLILGNVGELPEPELDALAAYGRSLQESWGIRIAVFEQDIEIGLLPGAVEDGSGG